MGTDLKAEILAQAARLEELIDRSANIIEKSNALIERSHRLIHISMGYDVDKPERRSGRAPRGNNHKTMPLF
jgi:hypothetical protein